ncbi:MAG: hypothetical protein K2X29_00990 [Candidatus Obscuribacterales bacterium]|nr:hypothetical protein [Candidatus Obscuribacterales bacterium]
MAKHVTEAPKLKLQSGDHYLTTQDYEDRYKIPRPSQCRHRKDGSGPPFVVHNGKILYPESGILDWMNKHLLNSTAELPAQERAIRYAHLSATREKAIKASKKSIS